MSSARIQRVTFAGADGTSRLAARLDLPSSPPRAWALFAHCFTCTHNVLAASRIADGLTSQGIAVLRFDFTGLGASEGDFANTNFSSNLGDLLAAAAWLRAEHEAPALMIGHSLGGAAVLAAAGGIPEARAFCTIAAPSEPAHLAKALQPAVAEIEARGEAEVRLAGQTFRIKKQFLDDIAGHKLAQDVAHLGRPLLIFHSPRDETVSIDNAARLFALARHPKSFVSLDDADHLLSRWADAASVASIIAAWVGRYLDEATAATPAQAEAEASVVITEAGTGKYAQVVSVRGKHILRADEPVAFGGTDTGPNPYEYLWPGWARARR